MKQLSTKWICIVGAAAALGASSMAGCGGSKTSDDTGNGGAAEGGSGNTAGDATSGGKTTAATGGKASGGTSAAGGGSSAPLPDGVTCGPLTAPGNPLLTDFSTIAPKAYNGSGFSWGDSAKTLTGGTFFYDGDGDDTVAALTVTVANEEATITGNIAATKYAGFGFWFGPCTDARAYTGLSFTIKGDMSNSQLQIQMQSSRNYPIDTANNKGECEGTWGKPCNSNAKTLSDLVLTTSAQTVKIPWADFTGGAPITPLESAELLGFQWHFNCGETACSPNVTIDDVTFY